MVALLVILSETMQKNITVVIGAIVLVVVGVSLWQRANVSNSTSQQNQNTSVGVMPAESTKEAGMKDGVVGASYTLDEIATHSKAEDCWMAIEGNVYDVTPYIQKQIHPGGAAVLFGCGKDSTTIFNLRPKDNKPHSQNAKKMLENYFIGTLAQ